MTEPTPNDPPAAAADAARSEPPRGPRIKLILECLGLVATLAATLYGLYRSMVTDPVVPTSGPIAKAEPAPEKAEPIRTASVEPLAVPDAAVMSHRPVQRAGQPQPIASGAATSPLQLIKDQSVSRLAHANLMADLDQTLAAYPQSLLAATVEPIRYDAAESAMRLRVRVSLDRAAYERFALALADTLLRDADLAAVQDFFPEGTDESPASARATTTLATQRRQPVLRLTDSADSRGLRESLLVRRSSREPTRIEAVAIVAPTPTGLLDVGQTTDVQWVRIGPEAAERLQAAVRRAVPMSVRVAVQTDAGAPIATASLPLATPEPPTSWDARRFVQPLAPAAHPFDLEHATLNPVAASDQAHAARSGGWRVLALLPGLVSPRDRTDDDAPFELADAVTYELAVPLDPEWAERSLQATATLGP